MITSYKPANRYIRFRRCLMLTIKNLSIFIRFVYGKVEKIFIKVFHVLIIILNHLPYQRFLHMQS